MLNTKFEASKIRLQIRRAGKGYIFQRAGKNAFGEPSGPLVDIGTVQALYHEQNSNIEEMTQDGARTRTKKIPMLMCLWSDIVPLGLLVGDTTIINGNTFKVTGMVDVQQWNIISDISLELIDDGTHTQV